MQSRRVYARLTESGDALSSIVAYLLSPTDKRLSHVDADKHFVRVYLHSARAKIDSKRGEQRQKKVSLLAVQRWVVP